MQNNASVEKSAFYTEKQKKTKPYTPYIKKMILTEIKKLQPKLEVLEQKYDEFRRLKGASADNENELFRIYEVLFKNFISRKTDTKVELKGDKYYGNQKIVCNINGFSLLYSYGTNSNYINNFAKLLDISKVYQKLIPYCKRKEKQKLMTNFFKPFENIIDFNEEMILEFDEGVKGVNEWNEEDEKGRRGIKFSNGEVTLVEHTNNYHSTSFRLGNLDCEDLVIIEQIYPDLVKLLDKVIRKMQKAQTQRQKVLEILKTKFSSELVLDQLSQDDKK